MKILLVGGGSGGPVTPLLAVADEIKKNHPKAEFLLVGTKNGPEGMMAKRAGISFKSIPAGKFRRYFSFANLVSPFFIVGGFFKSVMIIRKFRPRCVFGTGSFVQVPLVWAAWFLRIPVVIHQQDVTLSLANVLCEIPAAKITVTFENSLKDFPSAFGLFYKRKSQKVVFTGNPFRQELGVATKAEGIKFFHLTNDLPVLLVLGGGTGAEFINKLISISLPVLAKTVQIIHSTGAGKLTEEKHEHYHPYEFISNMGLAYAAADIVLCRAGLATITELSALQKLGIIIPMPNSHQEQNADMLTQNRAAIVFRQNEINAEGLIRLIRRLLFEPQIQQVIKHQVSKLMPRDAGEKIAEIIVKLAEK